MVGSAFNAAGAILPAIGSYLGNSVSISSTHDIAQEYFATNVQYIYDNLTEALDNATKILFKGRDINEITIIDMMKGGGWLNRSALIPLPQRERQIKTEILSHSIDALWKTPSKNKMWVQFIALGDDDRFGTTNCDANKSGPPDSKYCADSGVYYTYNFIETGDLGGYLRYPWGGDQLSKLGLDMKVNHL